MADAKNKTSKSRASAKGKANARGKGKGKGGKGGSDSTLISVAAHPRAGVQVRRAKGWGGLAGFVIAAYLSINAQVPLVDVGERALIAGAAGYLVAWACSVTVWRHLMLAELRAAHERALAVRDQGTIKTD
jgi:hypothetical protein